MHPPDTDTPGIIAPPPILYLGALALSALLQYQWPLSPWPDAMPVRWGGLALLGLGAGLAGWSFITLRRIGTTPNPYRPATALTVEGPYRMTRNPIYLAMTAIYLGLSLIAHAGWPLLMLVPLLALMHWGVILREERYLARRFGAEYTDYQARVGRWV